MNTGFNILQSLQSAFTTFVGYLPQVIGALLVLLIGFVIAKLLDKAITKGLQKAKVDDRLKTGGGANYVEKLSPRGSPAKLVGTVVFWVIMLFVISSAIGTLGIPALTGFMNQVLSYLPNVIAALLIFIVAAAVAGAVGGLVHRTMGDTPTGKIVRTLVPAMIMGIAVFMILTQLGISPVIVTITYVALVGAAALAAALAFGIGGREAAAKLVNSGYEKAREQNDTIRSDVAIGKQRAAQDAADAKHRAEQKPGGQEQSAPAAQPPPVQTQTRATADGAHRA
ncbi:mechanosensitive ion channel family protein [Amycolatopsis sp. CA-161197]|uniref:mechanosensitive ion channel family protein n=1 Tax=unclassified Amycolatopsis TaxID=2618356 RepID=UPI003451CDF1